MSSKELSSEEKIEKFVDSLCDIKKLFWFGDFVNSIGLMTPVILKFEAIFGHPVVLDQISTLLWECLQDKDIKYHQICPVTNTAQPMATLISVKQGSPMLIRHKNFDRKTVCLQGKFLANQTCVLIDSVTMDVNCILDVARDLRRIGLTVRNAVAVVDKQHGSVEILDKYDIKLKSVLTFPKLLDLMLRNEKIALENRKVINFFLEKNVQYKLK